MHQPDSPPEEPRALDTINRQFPRVAADQHSEYEELKKFHLRRIRNIVLVELLILLVIWLLWSVATAEKPKSIPLIQQQEWVSSFLYEPGSLFLLSLVVKVLTISTARPSTMYNVRWWTLFVIQIGVVLVIIKNTSWKSSPGDPRENGESEDTSRDPEQPKPEESSLLLSIMFWSFKIFGWVVILCTVLAIILAVILTALLGFIIIRDIKVIPERNDEQHPHQFGPR
mmetsp:Transcript_21753/g.33584  ORF Transcript_21753/g.33584 Transcript_21753/m.33584 type:complete len:227 (+) Transcript_21753:24-704(+)